MMKVKSIYAGNNQVKGFASAHCGKDHISVIKGNRQHVSLDKERTINMF